MKNIKIKIDDKLFDSIKNYAHSNAISFDEAIVALANSGLVKQAYEERAAAMKKSFEEESKELVGYEARRARLLSRSIS